MLLAVRMGRYLSGPGSLPIPGLVPAYLALLEVLGQDAEGDCCPLLGILCAPHAQSRDTVAVLAAVQQSSASGQFLNFRGCLIGCLPLWTPFEGRVPDRVRTP